MSLRKQQGFTLIEIAIVLVIIGLLLGGILQGQSLINSARVRNLISQIDGVKAAYYGFQDRYRALPGDFSQADTQIANVAAGNHGNGDGKIEPTKTGTSTVVESIAVWDNLSHAGFITGTYVYAPTDNPPSTPPTTPTNPWGAIIQLVYDGHYAEGATNDNNAERHNLKTGSQVPIDIIAEVDRKIDDGNAGSGTVRFSVYGGASTGCYASTGLWDTRNNPGETNCGAAILF
jgi:prepilin-type N-terminal cleavage/methylation domain-containing protein